MNHLHNKISSQAKFVETHPCMRPKKGRHADLSLHSDRPISNSSRDGTGVFYLLEN